MSEEARIEAKIERLQQQQQKLRAQIRRESGRLGAQKRKRATRAKIVLGGAVIAALKDGEVGRDMLEPLLRHVEDRDRELVHEHMPQPKAHPAKPKLSLQGVKSDG